MAQISELLTTFITNLYISTGLLGIVLAMAIESCCIPLPSEIVMPVAGLLLAQHKLLPGVDTNVGIVLLGLSGALGCLVGSILAYWIGYKGGRPLMLKYGRYVLISQHDADLADRFFQRWGSPTAFFSRLLPVVRTYISLPAGITKMSFTKFCIYSFLGSFPWCVLLAYAGVVLNGNMTKIEPYYKSFEYVIVALLIVLVVLYVWRHVRNDKRARAEHAAAEAAEENAEATTSNQPLNNRQHQFQQPWNQQPQQPQEPTQSQPPRW
ncbi:alkaline phosphatase [Dictyobacter alpinus]|uniref:Alkaline phosphatase n=1 Tax=Dictyobacter alpinus TaxID=2014873 RepID=A0A402B1U1_9CHLR|nr:DedA family protein [Dictyobacter alpinus]GCE25320.1 alkaline phosphatase [Dictyobacter alpinus]